MTSKFFFELLLALPLRLWKIVIGNYEISTIYLWVFLIAHPYIKYDELFEQFCGQNIKRLMATSYIQSHKE